MLLTQAAITKCYGLGGLNNVYLFLTILKASKSKIKVLANLVPGEVLFPGLVLTVSSHDRESKLYSLVLLLKCL